MPRDLQQAIGFLLGIAFVLWMAPGKVDADPDPALAGLEATLIQQVNAVRELHHLVPLQRTADLDAVARAHSRDMVSRGYVAHESPEGANAMHRLAQAKLEGFSLAAENIGATDRPGPNHEIVSSWLRSPTHRSNLLSPPFNATGVGIAAAPDGRLIYTQLYVTYPR